MRRSEVRALRHAATRLAAQGGAGPAAQQGQASALALLERSMQLGHDRLAVRRLLLAVQTGAPVRPEHWQYCLRVVARVADPRLAALYQGAQAAPGPLPAQDARRRSMRLGVAP